MTCTCGPPTARVRAGTALPAPANHAQIHAGGLKWDVAIEDAESAVPDEDDSAYRRKYGGRYASIVDSINDTAHRATTLRLTPQEAVSWPRR